MKKLLLLVLLILSSCAEQISPCAKEKMDASRQIIESNGYQQGVVVITPRDNVTKDQLNDIIAQNNFTTRHEYPSLNIIAINVPARKEFESICALEKSGLIERGELDILLKAD